MMNKLTLMLLMLAIVFWGKPCSGQVASSDDFESLLLGIGEQRDALTRNAQGEIIKIKLNSRFANDINLKCLVVETKDSLRSLELVCAKDLTEAGLKELGALTNLKSLRVGLVNQTLPNSFFQDIGKIRKLQNLELENLKLSPDDLLGIEELGKLEHLKLRNVKITVSSLAHISRLPELRELVLSGSSMRISEEDAR